MKKAIIYFSLVILSILLFSTLAFSTEKSAAPGVEEWIGKKVIFLPKIKELQHYGYQSYRTTRTTTSTSTTEMTYSKYVGKTSEIINVEKLDPPVVVLKMDGTSKLIYSDAIGNYLMDVDFVSEMEGAKAFIGKTVWNKCNKTTTGEVDMHGQISCERKVKNLEEIKIVDVKWGYYDSSPLRFIIETKDKVKGYWDGSFSRINDAPFHVLQPFEENWYFEDPHTFYPGWSKETWDAIENEQLYVGMTKEMVKMAWGEPVDVYTNTGDWGVYERITYENGVAIFEDGKLKSF